MQIDGTYLTTNFIHAPTYIQKCKLMAFTLPQIKYTPTYIFYYSLTFFIVLHTLTYLFYSSSLTSTKIAVKKTPAGPSQPKPSTSTAGPAQPKPSTSTAGPSEALPSRPTPGTIWAGPILENDYRRLQLLRGEAFILQDQVEKGKISKIFFYF